MFKIYNRRYTGSKFKLADWIIRLINDNCAGNSFFDIFAGTSVITSKIAPNMNRIILNDTLEANNIIYKAFYEKGNYNLNNLEIIKSKFNAKRINANNGYFAENYGGKYFSLTDCRKIENIRNSIEKARKTLTEKEYSILIASLIYSMDKCANTVGHFDAYRHIDCIADRFFFDLIQPFDLPDTDVVIYRKDANALAKEVSADIVYVDPPYNSRQYCRFYHIYETIVRWDNPKLFGVALKPEGRYLSDYCRSNAPQVFRNLIKNLNCRYIAVSYNNTYNSKSNSSRNKITFDEIEETLAEKGEISKYSKSHSFFNSGKTDFSDHKEFLFIVKVK